MSMPLSTWHAILADLGDVHWYFRRQLACHGVPIDVNHGKLGQPCSKDDYMDVVMIDSEAGKHRELHDVASKVYGVMRKLGKGAVEPTWEEPA